MNATQDFELLDAELFRAVTARTAGGEATDTLTAAVQHLRESAHAITDEQYAAPPRRRALPQPSRWTQWIAISGAAVAVAVVLSTIGLRSTDPIRQTPTYPAPVVAESRRAAVSDESLLLAVQSDLSDSIPSSMQALTTNPTPAGLNGTQEE